MKTAMLITLLLLPLLIHQAQGMGLGRKGILPNIQKFMSHNTIQEKGKEDAAAEVNSMWKSKYFSGRGRKLKITTSSIPTDATIVKRKKEKSKENPAATKEENLWVKSSSTAEERRPAAEKEEEKYPGILDLVGMDYSQARRKPPIHN